MTLEQFNFPQYFLAWYEYIVFIAVLASSLGIGIYYGFLGRKDKTNEEFLMGGRTMKVFPVTLSLLCSGISTTTLLGVPAELYLFGAPMMLYGLCFIPMTLLLAYLYVPVYVDLRLTSAYEYFEWRFSPWVRRVISLLALLQMLTYTPCVIWGPALALQQVAQMDPIWTAGVMFLVCITYSSIGGFKAVIWTDVLQGVVMFGSLIMVVIFGIYELGGIESILEKAEAGGRSTVFNFDLDPRARITTWTVVTGSSFSWLTFYGATQSQIQRYNSVSSLREAQKCLRYNSLGLAFLVSLAGFAGILIYVHFASCDPIKSKWASTPDQLLPLLVIDLLGKYSGLPGLLVAGMTCASLSTVSSVINAMAAVIVEDFVKWFRPDWDELKLGFTSKFASAISGLTCFALVFVVAVVNETVPIFAFVSILIACLYGPVFGAFTLGMIFPWVNTLGVICGIISAMAISGLMGISTIWANMNGLAYDQKLPTSTEGCNSRNDTFTAFPANNMPMRPNWKEKAIDADFLRDLSNISYQWQAMSATLITIIVGMAVSAIVNFKSKRKVELRLLSKPVVKFWKVIFGQEFVDKWILFETTREITPKLMHEGNTQNDKLMPLQDQDKKSIKESEV